MTCPKCGNSKNNEGRRTCKVCDAHFFKTCPECQNDDVPIAARICLRCHSKQAGPPDLFTSALKIGAAVIVLLMALDMRACAHSFETLLR